MNRTILVAIKPIATNGLSVAALSLPAILPIPTSESGDSFNTKSPHMLGAHSLGDVLLSRDPAVQVPSALEGLTVVFGMGTRGSLPPLSPNLSVVSAKKQRLFVQGDLPPENWMRNDDASEVLS